jgi:tRNA1(Val) A37 N6-methylase TrmN6
MPLNHAAAANLWVQSQGDEFVDSSNPEELCMARTNARLRMNFYPLPDSVAEEIGHHFVFQSACSVIDPCAGEGGALLAMTRNATECRRYGIELDAYRAEEAAKLLYKVIQGDALNTRCRVESFSLAYCNPPFDFEQGEQGGNQRMEKIFAAHIARWLVPAGILVLVIPAERLADCARTLAYHFTGVRAFRLEGPECEQYRQIVVFAKAKTRRERETTRDQAITGTQIYLSSLARDPRRIAPLSRADMKYLVPESGPAELVYDGLPLDVIEDLLPQSPAYRQIDQILNPKPLSLETRPVTPLHKGQIGLLAVAGAINSVVGSGDRLHIVAWQTKKKVTKWEEEEGGKTIIHERERLFTNSPSLLRMAGSHCLNEERTSTLRFCGIRKRPEEHRFKDSLGCGSVHR